jgi:cob(I)alamin adenosyltransferase
MTSLDDERGLPGLVMIYTGEGKGKTTSAFGVALRAVGRGWKVLMIQYTKSGEWPPGQPMGEIVGARRLEPEFKLIWTGIGFVNILGDAHPFEAHREAAQQGLELARQHIASGEYDLIILDEILGAVGQGQIDLEQLVELLKSRPRRQNLLLTGHDAEEKFIHELIPMADLVSEMKKIKHPFDEGHQARRGLDY